jgi:vancomycin resistance protein YoaR
MHLGRDRLELLAYEQRLETMEKFTMKQQPTSLQTESSAAAPPGPGQGERAYAGRYLVPPPPPPPASSQSSVAWEITFALLIVAFLVVVGAGLFFGEMWLADRILPGVRIWDVDVGGLTPEQARKRLAAGFQYPADRYPTLHDGDQAWVVSPADLGVQLDLHGTVAAAFRLGHSGDLRTRLQEQYDILRNGREVMPLFAQDNGTGAMFLSRIAQQINQPSRNASLSLNEDLEVVISPGQSGREVDEETTRRLLTERILTMEGGDVALAIRQSEPIMTDLETPRAEVERILRGPITLTAPDREPWTVEPATLAHWLVLQPALGDDGQATLAVSLDLGPAALLADEIAAQVARDPRDAQFEYDVARERVVITVESLVGQRLDVTATVSLIESAALGQERTVALPLIPILPGVASEDAPQADTFELISEGTSNFQGSSASRTNNIVVGAAQFDGLLIAPGETFSFNRHLGEVTPERGYEESIIIWGNETRADVGGGLCQVSTTAFRAAFWAGVPITERWPHLFRVSYYEPPKGMDATIYSPYVDLKWVNDTGEYILIRTSVETEKKTVSFRFYGRKPPRVVEMEGPREDKLVPHGPAITREDPTLPKGTRKQIEWAKDGLDVTVVRLIKENGQVVRRDEFFSRYQPWQAVFLVGTKEN